jgi:hypothetical protein
MNQTYHNDVAHIATAYQLEEEHINHVAQLAFFKINSYKLSLVNAAFCRSREELLSIIKGSLLNYIDALEVLSEYGFFDQAAEN